MTDFLTAVYDLRWVIVLTLFGVACWLYVEALDRAAANRRQAAQLQDRVDYLSRENRDLRWKVRILTIAVEAPRNRTDARIIRLPHRTDGGSL